MTIQKKNIQFMIVMFIWLFKKEPQNFITYVKQQMLFT
jgi:hypothetical protein